MSRRGDLSPEDRRIWARVAGSVTPPKVRKAARVAEVETPPPAPHPKGKVVRKPAPPLPGNTVGDAP